MQLAFLPILLEAFIRAFQEVWPLLIATASSSSVMIAVLFKVIVSVGQRFKFSTPLLRLIHWSSLNNIWGFDSKWSCFFIQPMRSWIFFFIFLHFPMYVYPFTNICQVPVISHISRHAFWTNKVLNLGIQGDVSDRGGMTDTKKGFKHQHFIALQYSLWYPLSYRHSTCALYLPFWDWTGTPQHSVLLYLPYSSPVLHSCSLSGMRLSHSPIPNPHNCVPTIPLSFSFFF